MYRNGFFILALPILLLAVSGCASPSAPAKLLPPGAACIYHLPGIAGDSSFDRNWTAALVDGGAADDVRICDWTCNQRWLGCLYADRRNHTEAARIARLVAARRAQDPTGRIILTSESAGCGIALWVLERLPQNVKVDDVVLVSPAVSPDFDLSSALRHVSGKIYYFDSPIDLLTLCVGTEIFGTIDQRLTLGAGLVGFHPPPNSDRAAYQHLVEVRYDLQWARWGYAGTHLSGLSSAWAYHVVAPMLVRGELEAAAQARAHAPPAPIEGGRLALSSPTNLDAYSSSGHSHGLPLASTFDRR